MTGKPKDVFLCHSWLDRPFVNRLAAGLQSAGLTVWLDEAEIGIGDSLLEKINSGIYESEFVAAILSPAAVSSPWVRQELDTAMNLEIRGDKTRVLPLLYQNCELPGFILTKRYLDFTDDANFGGSLSELIHAIKRRIFQVGESYIATKVREMGGEYVRTSDVQDSINGQIQLPDRDSGRQFYIAVQLKTGAAHLARETSRFVRIRLRRKEIMVGQSSNIPAIVIWVSDDQPDRYALWQAATVADPRARSIKIPKKSVFDLNVLAKLLELSRNWTGRPHVPILKSSPLGLTRVRDVRSDAWEAEDLHSLTGASIGPVRSKETDVSQFILALDYLTNILYGLPDEKRG